MKKKLVLFAATLLLLVGCKESNVDALDEKYETLRKETIPGLQKQLDLLGAAVTLTSNLTIVQSKLSNSESTLSTLKQQLSTATTNVGALQDAVKTMQTKVNSLQDQTEKLNLLVTHVNNLRDRMDAVDALDLATFKQTTKQTLELMDQTMATLAKSSDLEDLKGKFNTLLADYNLYNYDYKKFNADKWPVRSCGLLGPLSLREPGVQQPASPLKP